MAGLGFGQNLLGPPGPPQGAGGPLVGQPPQGGPGPGLNPLAQMILSGAAQSPQQQAAGGQQGPDPQEFLTKMGGQLKILQTGGDAADQLIEELVSKGKEPPDIEQILQLVKVLEEQGQGGQQPPLLGVGGA